MKTAKLSAADKYWTSVAILNIERLREERKLLKHEMLEKIPLSRAAYNNFERGLRTPTIQTLVKIAKFFNVKLNELLKEP